MYILTSICMVFLLIPPYWVFSLFYVKQEATSTVPKNVHELLTPSAKINKYWAETRPTTQIQSFSVAFHGHIAFLVPLYRTRSRPVCCHNLSITTQVIYLTF